MLQNTTSALPCAQISPRAPHGRLTSAPLPAVLFSPPRALPPELIAAKNWLVWKLVPGKVGQKPRKVPFYASGGSRSGAQGGDADRAKLATYDDAVRACKTGAFTGLGFAILPDLGIFALDFDYVVKDRAIDSRIQPLIAGTYSEISPSQTGLRAFYKGRLHSVKDVDERRTDNLFNVEVFGHNGFVTVTGDTTDECQMFGLEESLSDAPAEVLDMYQSRFGDSRQIPDGTPGMDGIEGFAALRPTQGWTLEQGRELLMDCDPEAPRDSWVKALMAMHFEFGGSPEALDICDAWSAKAKKYQGFNDVAGRWRSFGKQRLASITGVWLMSWRRECLSRQKYEAVADWKTKIGAAPDDYTLRENICPSISNDGALGDLERESLAQALADRFKVIGTKLPIAACRKLLEKPAPKDVGADAAPDWARDWVFVTDHDKFYRIDSAEWLSMLGFSAKHNRLLPPGPNGEQANAAWSALNDFDLATVTRPIYLPWAEPLFTLDGVACVNAYRPSSVPPADVVITPEGQAAITLVQQHLSLICGGRPEVVEDLISWMAWNVRHPGRKVRWAPVVKGVEGDGKSLIGNVMKSAMGVANVKQVSPQALASSFSDWAHGASVGVLEEIKLTGHNKHDVLNALKPFLTNDQIAVHPKGQAEFTTINTQNYIAFTNHADALPLNDTDRRWFVIASPFLHIEDMSAVVGDTSLYFNALFDAIEKQRGALRRWLLDLQIPARFKPNGRAPLTPEKESMIALASSGEEDAVRNALEEGGAGIGERVLDTRCLSWAVMQNDPDVVLQGRTMSSILGKLGWQKVRKPLKWQDRTRRIWVRGISPDSHHLELQDALDATLKGNKFESTEICELFA